MRFYYSSTIQPLESNHSYPSWTKSSFRFVFFSPFLFLSKNLLCDLSSTFLKVLIFWSLWHFKNIRIITSSSYPSDWPPRIANQKYSYTCSLIAELQFLLDRIWGARKQTTNPASALSGLLQQTPAVKPNLSLIQFTHAIESYLEEEMLRENTRAWWCPIYIGIWKFLYFEANEELRAYFRRALWGFLLDILQSHHIDLEPHTQPITDHIVLVCPTVFMFLNSDIKTVPDRTSFLSSVPI
jgi:hypothetical protein